MRFQKRIFRGCDVRLVCQFAFAVSLAVISGWFAVRAFNAAYYESKKCEAYSEPFDSRADTCKKLTDIHTAFQKYKDTTQAEIIEVLKTAENVSLYSECSANDIDSCKTACE
jgi:hypothetical protein